MHCINWITVEHLHPVGMDVSKVWGLITTGCGRLTTLFIVLRSSASLHPQPSGFLISKIGILQELFQEMGLLRLLMSYQGNGNPLQYSCLENPMDGGAWQAAVYGVRHDWVTSLSFSLACIWERNGNPLQCFCLENLRDRGAWWAAVYGVAQSRTRLKRFSSSSSSMGFMPWKDSLLIGYGLVLGRGFEGSIWISG